MAAQLGVESIAFGETQLEVIRDLMLSAASQGLWLTLEEIAAHTEFGEASISAQLRHLRKTRYGRFRVEKRRRNAQPEGARGVFAEDLGYVWEYQVLPPG
jgi:hypothetical protein